MAAAALTRRPVVIQFAFEVVGAERLQSELQLLPVERLSHAQLLCVDKKWFTRIINKAFKWPRGIREDDLTFSKSC